MTADLSVDLLHQFEERAVGLVVLLCGVIGLLVGVSAPEANALELALGSAMAGFGLANLRPRFVRPAPA